jgi:betaine-aldehyde dehydrogenase
VKEYKLYIDGKYVSSSAGTVADSINPADGSVFAKVHMASKEDIELAIASAHKAQKALGKNDSSRKGGRAFKGG